MNLIKDHWQAQDVVEFENYLLTFSKGKEKAGWEKRIINTNMPCIAVPSQVVNKIVSEIYKGNYLEFINLWIWNNYTESAIIGKLICKIKDFTLFKTLLTQYANKADNWATCDCLKLKITPLNKQNYYDFACELVKSENPFVKRVGLNIFLKLLDYKEYLPSIFEICNSFKQEEFYYVNMMVAWLVATSFAKHRNETLEYFKNNNLNKFTINKAISKCHDSYRVTASDKELLKTFRQ